MPPESQKTNHRFLVLVLFSAIFLFVFSQLSFFDRDEIEFVHTAWLISKGKIIYHDFFQHHHPLGYYFIIPILRVFEETASVLQVLRFFFFCVLMGVGFYTYKIARFFLDKNYSLVSVGFLFTSFVFNYAGVKIRSDPFLLLFTLASFYFLLSYFRHGKKASLIASSIFSSLAFLVFQKAVFYLFSVFVVYLVILIENKRRNFFRDGLLYVVVFLALTITGYFSLVHVPFSDYFFLNWKINMDIPYRFSPLSFWSRQALYNPALVLLALGGLFWAFFKNRADDLMRITGIHLVILLASMFFFLSPAWQYHLVYYPFLVLFSGYAVSLLVEKGFFKKIPAGFLGAMFLISVFVNFLFASNNIRKNQIRLIAYGIEKSGSADYVCDPYLVFNLFRHDCDYFWFGLHPGKGLYHAYVKTRSYSYNLDEIVQNKKPKLISSYLIYPDVYTRLLRDYTFVSTDELGIKNWDIKKTKERLYPVFIRKN